MDTICSDSPYINRKGCYLLPKKEIGKKQISGLCFCPSDSTVKFIRAGISLPRDPHR